MDETRTAAGKAARRRRAVQKVEAGWSQKDVADFPGVRPVTVSKWVRAHRADPGAGLAAEPHPGRTPPLTAAQERKGLGRPAEKPTRHGFPTDLWTARRAADRIRTKFPVEFHPGYLREWMSKRGLSPQEPARRSKERNPEGIRTRPADGWPATRKRGPRGAPTSCGSAGPGCSSTRSSVAPGRRRVRRRCSAGGGGTGTR